MVCRLTFVDFILDPVYTLSTTNCLSGKFNSNYYKSLSTIRIGDNDDHILIGSDRPKFFTHYATNPFAISLNAASKIGRLNTPEKEVQTCDKTLTQPIAFITRAVQTVFRESEAQTDPYSPPYVFDSVKKPELLMLAHLTYGSGLPASLREIEGIERARKRYEIEKNLEPFYKIAHDPILVAKRRKVLDDLETKEWYYREKEVEALQKMRLNVLVELIRKKEMHNKENNFTRLDNIWKIETNKKEEIMQPIRKKYMRALRKLIKDKEILAQSKHKHKDIIDQYSSPHTQTFTPLTRYGVFPDQSSEFFTVKNHYLTTIEGIQELQSVISQKDFIDYDRLLKKKELYTKEGFPKRFYREQCELNELKEQLEEIYELDLEKSKVCRKSRFLEAINKPLPRIKTPEPFANDDAHDYSMETEVSAINLQKLIRGRAIQKQMFEGRTNCQELIAELRSTHTLLKDEQAEIRRQKLVIQSRQENAALICEQENKVDDVLANFGMDNLAGMLDFLSKELDRLVEERRVHAELLLAKRSRRMNEAEESGKRQLEERMRRENDEVFKQLIKVHQETVDDYLTQVAGISMEVTATHRAEQEVQHRRSEITFEYDLNSKELAGKLMFNFVIPEVNRRSHENEKAKEYIVNLKAAHDEIWSETNTTASTSCISSGISSEPNQQQTDGQNETGTHDKNHESDPNLVEQQEEQQEEQQQGTTTPTMTTNTDTDTLSQE